MFSFSQKTKTIAMSVASVGLLTAMSCGIIDTEQVTSIIEKQQEVERIRRERIQPLINEVERISREKIEPMEKQIRDLERERDDIFREMETTEGEKRKEMEAKYKELRQQERALQEQARPLETQMRDMHEVERQQAEMEMQKAWREVDMEGREIEQEMEKFHRGREQGPPPEMRAAMEALQTDAQMEAQAMHEEMEERQQALHKLFDVRRKEQDDKIRAQNWALQDRRDQLDTHRENLNTRQRLGHIQDNIDRNQKELERMGAWGSSSEEALTVDELNALIIETQIKMDALQPMTDPRWTEKLLTLEAGSPEYDAHIQDEANWQIMNPDGQKLQEEKQDYERRRNNISRDPEQQERNAERIAEIQENLAESQAEYDQWALNLTEVTITAVDTSIIDGDIEALKLLVGSVNAEIAAVPEDERVIQDPAWTEKLLVLTTEVGEMGAKLAAAEEAIANMAVFITDPNNADGQIQNPEYTEADQAYAALAMAKNEKQQEYEAHIRNQGQVSNPLLATLSQRLTDAETALKAKEGEKAVLLSGGTADSGGLPDNEAAIQREQKKLNQQMEALWRDNEVTMQAIQEATQIEIEVGQKALQKERQTQERLIWGTVEVEQRAMQEEMNKPSPEMLALQDRMYGLNDKRNQLEDMRFQMQEDFQIREQALNKEMRVLEEQRRDMQGKYMDLEDEAETMFEDAIKPIEEKVRVLEETMDQTFIALELAYEERGQVEGELEQVKQEIEDLAREAESDVLTLITDAMSAAEQLEKRGPLDFAKFQAGFGDMGDMIEEGEESEEGGEAPSDAFEEEAAPSEAPEEEEAPAPAAE